MMNPTLEFLRNEAGEKEGLADAGIETFRDAPYASCAREAGQNARDAEAALPVKLTFDVFRLTPGQFPAHTKLVKTLEACASAAEQEKEIEFFKNALKVATKPAIPVLEIADFNTKGLTGPPNEPGTPFHSLLKSTGVSTKESETSGGSFGIGKNASFAVSELQMVLYSTAYVSEDGSDAFAAQGKIKLVSHQESNDSGRRATGYWGHPAGFTAITDREQVPTWLRRVDRGTSIFCMGFREADDWGALMTSSLVTNFFCAVHRNEMVFDVASGLFEINPNTVEHLLAREDIRAAAEKSGQLPNLEFSAQLYRCLVSPLAKEQSITIPDLGEVRVRILVESGLPRRIGFIRNGMYVTDNLRHFGQPLERFPGSRDFVALVEPVTQDAGKLLKRLENPAHDAFSAQRISDPEKRKAAETAMKRLGKQLREMIKQTTGVAHQDSVVLDELAHLFAQPGNKDASPGSKGEDDPETQIFSPAKRKPARRVIPAESAGQEGGRAGTGAGGGGDGGGSGDLEGAGSGGRGRHSSKPPIPLKDIRNTIQLDENGQPYSRRIHFTPDVEGPIQLALEATGVNQSVALGVIAADRGEIYQGKLRLTVSAGDRVSVSVTFAEPYDGPVEVVASTPAPIGESS
jgi:hypothetical protein